MRRIYRFDGWIVLGFALKLAPLVFVRPGELRTAEWSHFDLEGGTWRIPAHRMKSKVQHLVPLSAQTRALLIALKTVTGNARWVFPSRVTPDKPMSVGTLNAGLHRLGFSQSEITPHGFRGTACTLLNELGWRSDVIERQLAHRIKDETRRAYDYAQYLSERRTMMRAWADYLDALRKAAEKPVGPLPYVTLPTQYHFNIAFKVGMPPSTALSTGSSQIKVKYENSL